MNPDFLDPTAAFDPVHWQRFAPELHVTDAAYLNAQTVIDVGPDAVEALRGLIRAEGYFQLPPQSWDLPLQRMVDTVKKLDADGMPLPFSFVYDEFWVLYLRLHRVLEALIGPGYLRLPDFWTWLVDPKKSASGWTPHRDKNYKALFPDGSPKAVTIWIPLTDATTLNGCMYIVPADRDRVYGTPQDEQRSFELADIRALPAQAGSVLCWNQSVLHWGSHSNPRESEPRVSVAFEFQSGQVEPYNQPVTAPTQIPSLALRLRLVGKQILQYKHMYPLSPEMEAYAERLCEEAAALTSS